MKRSLAALLLSATLAAPLAAQDAPLDWRGTEAEKGEVSELRALSNYL